MSERVANCVAVSLAAARIAGLAVRWSTCLGARVLPLLKMSLRVAIALFCAALGALTASVSICPLSVYGPLAPSWAPWICGENVWRQWIVVGASLFLVALFLTGERFRPFRRHAAAALLAFIGLYMLRDLSVLKTWWAVFPIAMLVAAAGLLANLRWARYLAYVLALLFAVYWGLWTWLSLRSAGYLR